MEVAVCCTVASIFKKRPKLVMSCTYLGNPHMKALFRSKLLYLMENIVIHYEVDMPHELFPMVYFSPQRPFPPLP